MMRSWESYQGLNVFAAQSATTAQNPYLSGSKFIVSRTATGEGEVIVVTGIAPWAKTLVGPGTGSAALQYITPDNGDGFFLYEPQLAGGSAQDRSSEFALSAAQNSPGTITDLKTGGGVTPITNHPRLVLESVRPSDNAVLVIPPSTTLMWLFSLVPAAITSPLDQRYTIGGTVIGTLSVNYAGVAMLGKRMPLATFEAAKKHRGWG